jgi:hypothetical protein
MRRTEDEERSEWRTVVVKKELAAMSTRGTGRKRPTGARARTTGLERDAGVALGASALWIANRSPGAHVENGSENGRRIRTISQIADIPRRTLLKCLDSGMTGSEPSASA